MAETVYILIGSNVGDREKILSGAVQRLTEIPGLETIAVSAVYISEAEDMPVDSPAFMNQVVMADYQYLPHELLDELEAIEVEFGRTDKGMNQPRTLDLDILLFGQQVIETERLTIPHRELLNRGFAMIPLMQISPEVFHPVKHRPIAEFVTDAHRKGAVIYRDHVARSI